MSKIRFVEKRYNFEIKKIVSIKIEHDNFEASDYVVWKFQIRIL